MEDEEYNKIVKEIEKRKIETQIKCKDALQDAFDLAKEQATFLTAYKGGLDMGLFLIKEFGSEKGLELLKKAIEGKEDDNIKM